MKINHISNIWQVYLQQKVKVISPPNPVAPHQTPMVKLSL